MMLAFLLALTATLGALFIGEVMGQMPCTLCWYQRIAMFPLTVILGVALWRGDDRGRAYAMPLVIIGLVIAIWHSGLYLGLIPEAITPCTETGPSCSDKAQMSIMGLPIPYLSAAAFFAIGLCLLNLKGSRS
ncbi:disulfide bond formation protein B [Paracoccus hibiscisoli]